MQRDLQIFTKQQFGVFEKWIIKQLQVMGWGKKSAGLTIHLMVWTQGVMTMAYIHQGTQLIQNEVKSIDGWLESLSDEKN